MLVDLDVIIETGAALLPRGVGIGFGGEILERGAVELLEQLPTARSEMAGDAAIELVEELTDGGVGLGQGEEPAVPELGQDPSLDDLDADLDLGLVARLADARPIRAHRKPLYRPIIRRIIVLPRRSLFGWAHHGEAAIE